LIHRRWRFFLVALTLSLCGAACSGVEHTSADFCDKLVEVTGPSGVESTLVPGDPARIDGVVIELAELHDRAPEEISNTTRTLLSFFRTYQRAARDERRDVIANNEQQLEQASAELRQYALDECGLFLERVVPTPRPTVDPTIRAPITD
jgi:uncharacterized membrane protein